jgi:hypothetical protein
MPLSPTEVKYFRQRLEVDSEFTRAIIVNSINPWFGEDRGQGILTSGVSSCMAIATPTYLAHISPIRSKQQIAKFIELLMKQSQAGQIQIVGQSRSIARKKVLEVLKDYNLRPVRDISFRNRQTAYSVYVKNGEIRFVKD